MSKIGLFYGSDTGNTEGVAHQILTQLGEDNVTLHDIYETQPEDFDNYDKIIIGLSTWYDGQLQSDWDDFFESFKGIDFNGKTIAFFGLGDSVGYAEYYCDGIGILGEVVKESTAKIVGKWSTEGYEHTESKADMGDGFFMGLCLDEDNQPELTEDRLARWIEIIKPEFGL